MSYEIIYDKQFIKAEKEGKEVFVPMILAGSNNCYEWGNGKERRARSWWAFTYHANGEFYATKEEFLKSCDEFRQGIIDRNNERPKDEWFDEYDDKSFGYWSSVAIGGSTRNTTYGRYKGIFNTGCDKALSVEELAEENVEVVVKSYSYKDEGYEEHNKEKLYEVATSGEHLIKILDEAKEYFKDTGISVQIDFSGMYENTPKWLRKKFFPKEKTRKEKEKVNEFYAITLNGRYFVRMLKYGGYRYSFNSPQKKFKTENEAQRFCNKMNKKYQRYDYDFEVEKIEDEAWV